MRNRVLLSTERIFLILLVGIFISYAGNQFEMENLRGYHHKTFLNEDGSYTTEVSLGYQH